MSLRGPPDERNPNALLEFGVVNLDKPPGPSAHQVTAWVRDMVGVERAAHGGTLDPKVTGCLPVLTGDATRLAPVFGEGTKAYVAVLELHGPAPGDLEAVASEFEGEIYQKPPKKSAVARRLRTRTVHELSVLEVEDRRALLEIHCEPGTYVRKLCHDLGLALGVGAHMGHMRRIGTDPFDDTDLATLHDLADALAWYREDDDEGPLRAVIEPAERALVHLPRVIIAESASEEVAEGAPVYAPGVLDIEPAPRGRGNVVSEPESNDDIPVPGSSREVPAPGSGDDAPLVACYTPDGAAVCLGRLVGDPDAESGTVVDLERVLV